MLELEVYPEQSLSAEKWEFVLGESQRRGPGLATLSRGAARWGPTRGTVALTPRGSTRGVSPAVPPPGARRVWALAAWAWQDKACHFVCHFVSGRVRVRATRETSHSCFILNL